MSCVEMSVCENVSMCRGVEAVRFCLAVQLMYVKLKVALSLG